ncbi:MAG TPA: glycosyltransferase family 4 protein [Candidatus Saccharimonadales bacterium]|nr:glycosyltransferase family 4 protein [Candidatus Saccharimonadales bacterium]
MKIAMVAPPWLPIPPVGYGGIENVLAALVPALMEEGVEVELFTVGDTTLKANKNHWLYEKGQYDYIHAPMYDSLPVPVAHTFFAFNTVKAAGDFDVVHTHNTVFVDVLGGAFAESLPPIIHTLHGPPFTTPDRLALNLADNMPMWEQIGRSTAKNFYVVGISKALMASAPKALQHLSLKPVHNGINPSEFTYREQKDDYFITLARSHPEKGQGIAARLCHDLGYKLRMAGVVADMTRPKQVMMELANPLSKYRGLADFRYFSDAIFPYLNSAIEYVGDVSGQAKMDFLSSAKALLFPIQWEEPFGMAPIEALACGTPVVSMARGALREIIQHGVNGFLANDEQEFKYYMQRVDDIDPAACRKSVEDNFSARHMAQEYIKRYKTVMRRRQRQRMTVKSVAKKTLSPLRPQIPKPVLDPGGISVTLEGGGRTVSI